MAGDTFDAGTVYAEARLGRDEFRRDLATLKREIVKFERDAKVIIRPEVDPAPVAAGVKQAKAWLKELADYKVAPHVDLTGVEQAKAQAAALQKELQALGRTTVRPKVVVDVDKPRADVKKLTSEMSDAWGKVGGKIVPLLRPLGMVVGGTAAFAAASWAAVAALQMVQTAAGGLLVLPAILSAGVITVSALKMGLNGVGAALKAAASGDATKLNEALAKLAPNARAFVLEMQKLTPAWKDMRLDVQQTLFVGLAQTIGQLGRTYIPTLRTGLTDVAAELNIGAHGMADFLLQARSVDSVATIFANTRAAMVETRGVGAAIVQILLDIATVGSQFLPGLASGFGNAAASAAAYVRELRDSGQLAVIIERGLQTLFSLAGAIDSVFGMIRGAMRAAGLDGAGLAASLATILQRWEDWVNSARGQEVLARFFALAGDTARALAPLLGAVALAAGQMMMTLLPALPPLANGLTAVLGAAAPMLGLFSDLAVVVLPLLGAGLSFLAPVLGPLVALILGVVTAVSIYKGVVDVVTAVTKTWAVAQAILNGTMVLNPIGLVVVALVALAAALVWAWNNSETFRSIVVGAWEGIKTAAAASWSFLQTVFAALVSAAVTVGSALAAAWSFVASAASTAWSAVLSALTTAWGAIVAAAQWVGGILAAAWDGIVTAFRAVGDAATWLWNTILSPVFSAIGLAARILIAVIVTILLTPLILAFKGLALVATWLWESGIKPAFDGIVAGLGVAWGWIRDNVFTPISDFISGILVPAFLYGRDQAVAAWVGIQTGLGIAWQWILDTVWNPLVNFTNGILVPAFLYGRDQAVAAWVGIQTGLGIAWQWILDTIWNPLVNFTNGILVPAFLYGRDQAVAAWVGIQTGLGIAWQWILDTVWNPLVNFTNGILVPAFLFGRDQAVGAWNGLRDGLAIAWNWLRDNVFNPIATFVTVTIPDAFNTAVSAIKTAWDKISGIVAAPIKFMVNLVYNEGIVPAWNWIAKIVGLAPLETVNLGFAAGGVLPGYSPGRDNMVAASPFGPVALAGGEAIMRPEWTRAVGKREVDQMNLAARRGGAQGVRDYLQFGGETSAQFAQGGVAPLQTAVASGQAFARREAGKPYIWGGVGPQGYDCSGLISAVTNVVLGLGAHARRFATGSFGPGHGAGGFVPGTGSAFVIGVSPDTGGGVGHMAGNLGGLGIESRGGDGVVVGGAARSPTAAMFPWQFFLPQAGGQFVNSGGGVDIWGEFMKLWTKVSDFMGRISEFMGTVWGQGGMGLLKSAVNGIFGKANEAVLGTPVPVDQATGPGAGNYFDQGGMLPVGTSIITNHTGQPEPVLTSEQWRAITAAPRATSAADPRDGAGGDQIERLTRTMTEVKELLERRGTGATVNINGSQGSPVETARAAVLQLRLS